MAKVSLGLPQCVVPMHIIVFVADLPLIERILVRIGGPPTQLTTTRMLP